jgi:predicted lysophospholipase L1 biosynthesis ABC-type transport system permease subunit
VTVATRTGVTLALLLLCAASTGAVTPAMSERAAAIVDAIAIPATSPITRDGRMTEPFWDHAPSINEFAQRDPAEGQAPSQRTDARIASDDKALFAVRAFDTESPRIVGMLTRRDQRSPSDGSASSSIRISIAGRGTSSASVRRA